MYVSLEVVIKVCFGEQVCFYICLVEGMIVGELVVFLVVKGKFIFLEEGFLID